jgi:hypothetical protein
MCAKGIMQEKDENSAFVLGGMSIYEQERPYSDKKK